MSLQFSMYAKVRMSEAMSADISGIVDAVSPGGYTIESCGESYHFDFSECICTADVDDPTILYIEGNYPDSETFSDINRITEETLAKVTKFSEFFIYTAAEYGSKLHPIELLACTFTLADSKDIEVSKDACHESKVICEVEPTSLFGA